MAAVAATISTVASSVWRKSKSNILFIHLNSFAQLIMHYLFDVQYQETMKQYGQAQQAPPLPVATQPPPPPPKEDKPPLPPASTAYGYSTSAPPVSLNINFQIN